MDQLNLTNLRRHSRLECQSSGQPMSHKKCWICITVTFWSLRRRAKLVWRTSKCLKWTKRWSWDAWRRKEWIKRAPLTTKRTRRTLLITRCPTWWVSLKRLVLECQSPEFWCLSPIKFMTTTTLTKSLIKLKSWRKRETPLKLSAKNFCQLSKIHQLKRLKLTIKVTTSARME